MTTLGKYELHEQLGKGGFGTVYRATDTSLGREVALKILHPQLMVDEEFISRFKREARTLAGLDHPGIVAIHELGEIDGRVFIAMRYLSGGSLQQLLQKGLLSYQRSLVILTHICEALQIAHDQGLVHRDIKPANILFDGKGNVVLSDFGLARTVQLSSSSMSSSTGVVGTPAYRAPELWRGKPPASPATDVYSLGCIIVEMLTGKTLFDGETPDEILTQHLIDGPSLPEQLPGDCPQGLRTTILKALSKAPGERQKDAKVFLDEISVSPVPSIQVVETKTPKLEQTPDLLKQTNSPPVPAQSNPIREMSLDLGNEVSMEFVYVPAGEFLMGSDPKVDKMVEEDELPLHKVYLDEYWIGKYPVTTKQFNFFLVETDDTYQKKIKNFSIDEKPMVGVTWEDAQKFCQWMACQTNKKIGLPTESQWEKAARGTDGRIYPWGNEKPDCEKAKFLGCRGEIDPVGRHPSGVSPCGAQDMAGNVWEWAADWYDEKYYSITTCWNNPTGPATGTYRVLRGGSWYNFENIIRSANRLRYSPSFTYPDLGFRCALTLD